MSFPSDASASNKLYDRALKVLPDGGSRSSILMSPYPIYASVAKGKYVTDVDGNRYFDLNNNMTSLIHGHSHPEIVEAVKAQVEKGSAFSFTNEPEIRLAELLCSRVPSFEHIRFMNSGTEAVMNAVKAARAFTGKSKIAKCENAYHGTMDTLEVSLGVPPTDLTKSVPPSLAGSRGTPQGVVDDVLVIPYNEPEICERLLMAQVDELAAIVIDPAFRREAPTKAFVDVLRACQAKGVLIILDEVIAFRADFGGSQRAFDMPADLTALGKIIGGGFPVGAVAGRADVMSVFAAFSESGGHILHAGTFNGNPVTMVAGLTAMEMMQPDAFDHINTVGQQFREEMQKVFALTNTAATVKGHHSMFMVDIHDEDLAPVAEPGKFSPTGLQKYMLNNGYFLAPNLAGAVSTIMDTADVAPFCDTLLQGIREIKGEVA